jgi:hypothetical protein
MLQVVIPYRIGVAAKAFQEIAPAYRPYPKPTQVDW